LTEAPSYTISFYYRKILVPIDGSETSLRALHVAVDIAQRYGSKVVVVYAKPKNTELGEDPIIKAKERLKETPVNITYKYIEFDPRNDSASSALLREILEEGYDLVVIGARGKSLFGEINIGSTTLAVVVNAPTSVFIVR